MVRLILIDGPQGSGKTLLARMLGAVDATLNDAHRHHVALVEDVTDAEYGFLMGLASSKEIVATENGRAASVEGNLLEILFVTSYDEDFKNKLKQSRRLTGVLELKGNI